MRTHIFSMLQAATAALAESVATAIQAMVDEELTRRREAGNDAAAVPVPVPVSNPNPNPVRNEPTVTLWSSEIGAYMGRDTWTSKLQALAKVWRRTHEPSYREAHVLWLARGQKPLRVTSKQVMAALLRDDETDVGGGGDKKRKRCMPSNKYFKVQTVADVVDFRARQTPKDVLALYKEKGVLLEEDTAQLFSRITGHAVEMRNAGVTWSPDGSVGALRECPSVRPVGPILDPGAYTIVGEVDGVLCAPPPHGNTPVEIKVRMCGIPATIPFKDVAQVHSYMAMLGATQAFHVQRAFATDEVKTTTVQWNAALWDKEITPALEAFVCDVRKLLRGALSDEQLRHDVFASVETIPAPPMAALDVLEVLHAADAKPLKVVVTKAAKKQCKVGSRISKCVGVALPEVRTAKYNLRTRGTTRVSFHKTI